MRSILLTILAWSVATIGLTVLGIVAAPRALDHPAPARPTPSWG